MTPLQADIDAVANAIKEDLQSGAVDGSAALVRFADDYAVTAKLRHAALLLKLNYGKAEDRDQRERLKCEMVDLVDEIVADHSTLAHSEDVLHRQQAIKLVRSHYRDVQPPRDLVFACEDLGRTYAKSGFTLSGVNLALRLGTITGVVGENATGKTTLFLLVVGELRHTAGTLSYPSLNPNGEDDINWPQVKSQIAYVPQELPRWYGSLKDNSSTRLRFTACAGKIICVR